MEIKGAAVKSINAFVYDNHRELYEEWLNSLSSESKHFMVHANANEWYPVQKAAIEPTTRIGELIFNGNLQKGAFQAGKYSAITNLHGMYKLFVRFSSPGHVVDRGARILATFYRPSTFTMLERKKQSVRFEISDCIGINSIIQYRMAGWIFKALEMSGCRTIEVDMPESEPEKGRVVFKCKWT